MDEWKDGWNMKDR